MGITPNFTPADIKAELERRANLIEDKIIERLIYLGEQCVTVARNIPPEIGFIDRTGNLRSSIGYVVYAHGKEVAASFPGSESEGVNAGKKTAKDVGSGIQGYVLVVVAGMEYATYVESTGRDVLTSAESFAKQNVDKIIRTLIKSLS